MSAGLLLAVALAAAGPDPCAPVEAGGPNDPVAAQAYAGVGDEERAAGRVESATVAYLAAARLDPANPSARAGLAALCREQARQGAFDEGLRLMRQGDCRAALPRFEAARDAGDRTAALLAGACRYELGEDRRAVALLREAETDPDSRDPARLFLGLVALRQGRTGEAVSLLEASSQDPGLEPLVRGLIRTARRQGRLVLSLVAESGWDSNVVLAPDGSPSASRRADGMAAATVGVSYAPQGTSGPYLLAAGTWREQFRVDEFDMKAVSAGAGWQLGRGRRYALLEYGYDYRDLGSAPYLSAHRLLAGGRVQLSEAWSAGATWLARSESFLTTAARDYSGLRQAGEADLTVTLGRWTAAAAWRAGWDRARAASSSWWEQGPRLSVRKGLGPSVRAGLDASWAWRRYRADPALPVVRRDGYADASAVLEIDLEDRWTLRLEAAGRRATSSLPDFRYTKLVPTIGLAGSLGLL